MTQPTHPSDGTTRRDIIKGAAALSTAALAANLGISSRAHAAGSEEIKVGLVGCGGRGSGAANQALSTEGAVKLVAVADAFKDRLDGAVRGLTGEHKAKVAVNDDSKYVGFDAYKKLIDRSDIDLVILATPPGFRPIHFEYAVSRGKHVFMEKPVATDAPGVRRVLAAAAEAKKKNLRVGVGLQRHHQQNYVETIKKIQDGYLGKVIAMRSYWNGDTPWVRPRQAQQTEMEYQMRNWYFFNWLCGDNICEQHIHNLDVCNWVMNDHPVSAHGMGGREVRKGKDHGEIYDHHALEFTYKDGTKMFSQCRHMPNTRNDVSEWVHGEKGAGNIAGNLQLYSGERFNAKGGKDPYQKEHDDLFSSLRNNNDHNEAVYGAHSTMTSILGRMCTYSGIELSWDDALNWGNDLMPKNFAFDAKPPIVPDAQGNYPIAVPGVFKPLMFDPRNKNERDAVMKKYRSVPGGYELIDPNA
jgi:predicted dehydrogenase